jgi:hypothetical protein
METDELRRRYQLVLAGHPLVLLPGLGGMLGFAVAPFAASPAIPAFLGLVSLAGAGLAFAFRATVQADAIHAQVRAERDAERERDAAASAAKVEADLSALRATLEGDGDPRTETLFDDLRSLAAQFDDGHPWIDNLDDVQRQETQRAVRALFETSMAGLRDAMKVYEGAREISHKPTRQRLREQREAILAEVGASVEMMGEMLARIQALGVGARSSGDQAEARQRLADHVQAVVRTEEQMRRLAGGRREAE